MQATKIIDIDCHKQRVMYAYIHWIRNNMCACVCVCVCVFAN